MNSPTTANTQARLTDGEASKINVARAAGDFLFEIIGASDRPIESHEDLLLTGLLDSLGVVRLVNHLEERFDVKIPYRDIHPGNFKTLETIGTYVSGLATGSE